MRASPFPAPRPLIVGIGGTMRSGSGTERVLRAALAAAERRGAQTLLLAGPDLDLPMYAPQSGERVGAARALVDWIGRADGVIVASPAYHGGVSGLVKNALDYVEDLRDAKRPYLDGRPVGCIACAGGWQAAVATLTGLRSITHALRGWPTPLGVALNTSEAVFGPYGALVDAAALGQVEILADQVVSFARRHAGVPADRHNDRLPHVRNLRPTAGTHPLPSPLGKGADMTHTTNDRDRLMLAFAELNRHGILARPGLATTADQGHALLRADLAARHPYGLGSYAFWTQADEHRFDPTGDLTAALPVHCSSEAVAAAVEAVCRGARLDAQLHVAPAAPRRAATPARRTDALSPGRRLGARVPVIES